jgi:hypothetical protein
MPLGRQQFSKWAGSVISITPLPDNDSMRFTLAGIIMQDSGRHSIKSKYRFAIELEKYAANQIAHAVFSELKQKQQEAQQKAAATPKLVEGSGKEV